MVEKPKETVLDNGVLDAAMELAEGHPQRIEILDNKTAIVWNSREQKHAMQARGLTRPRRELAKEPPAEKPAKRGKR